MKKLYLILMASAIFAIGCSDDPPSVRVNNQKSSKANVQIKLADANTININDVEAGASSSYRDIAEGATQATATIQNEKESPSISFSASKNMNYTVVIQNTTPATLKVDSSDK